ncbi:MAG TPA: helix-turn-helix transcriptional regulator [Spirochaetia bacterium]
MPLLRLYVPLLVLLLTTISATLCFTSYSGYRHRAALWLSLCMVGLSFFALTLLVTQVAPRAELTAGGLQGPGLIWQALGSLAVVHALPRFLLSAFGASRRTVVYRLLDVATGIVAVLSGFRVVTGWHGLTGVAALPNNLLRVVLFAVIGGSLALTLVFQSRLPDRSLFRAVIVQCGALAVLFPFVVLEDVGVFGVPGLPYLAGELVIAVTAASAAVQARKNLTRPKYVVDESPSSYFVEHFGISAREREIVVGVLSGLGNNEIAARLFISPRTVEKHLYNIYQKTGIRNRLQLFNLLRSDTL